MDRRTLIRSGLGAFGAAGLGLTGMIAAPRIGRALQPVATAPMEMPPVTAVFASAIRADTGAELYRKAHATQTRFPASLVKLATALVVYRRKRQVLRTGTLTVQEQDIPSGQTNAGYKPGDIVTWEAALHGLLMASAGDAAEAMARVIGTEIHRESGEGTTGRQRFIEEMNAVAWSLGLLDSTFGSPTGVVQISTSTASDIARLARAAWSVPLLEQISGKPSYTMRVEGPNARSYPIHHSSKVINGPVIAPSGIGIAGVVAAKTGTSGSGADNEVVKWMSPAGRPVILCVIDSDSDYGGYLDVTGTLMQLPQDFRDLESVEEKHDPHFSNVALLSGADDGFRDEGPAANSLHAAGGVDFSTVRPLAGRASYLFDGIDGHLRVDGPGDLALGSDGGDFTIELDFSPDGPSLGICTLLSKFDRALNSREYEISYDPAGGIIAFLVSTDGREERSVGVPVGKGSFWSGGRRSLLVQRRGGRLEMFINHDRVQGDVVPGSLYSGSAPLLIGCGQESGKPFRHFMGRIDEVRITRGVARAGDTPRMASYSGRFPRTA